MNKFLAGTLAILLLAGSTAHAAEPDAGRKPNVLFIAIDDLRNDLGCLGVEHARTPELDTFARSSRLFRRHYVQVPTCGASRCALLSGRYPSRRAHVGNNAIRDTHADWGAQSLPAWFRHHGYRTLSLGKISHYPGGMTGKDWAEPPEELPGAWDRCWIPDGPWKTPLAIMHGYANGVPREPGKSPPWEAFDGPDEAYPDAWVASDALSILRELKDDEKPWFFAAGFFKPHLPFAAPKKWFDLHEDNRIPDPANPHRPQAPTGWHRSGEFRNNYGHEPGRDPETDEEYARLMRHAYAAATSYVDAQVGRVLSELDSLGLSEGTIVVIWSDHGFLLGEHAMWGKHTLYEQALLCPLMIRHPGLKHPGETSDAIVETIDLFPTLTDLCGLSQPPGLDGVSLRPQLDDPTEESKKPALAFWQDRRTLRTGRWRMIVHPNQENGVELFDVQRDPHETTNVAVEHPEVIRELRTLFKGQGSP